MLEDHLTLYLADDDKDDRSLLIEAFQHITLNVTIVDFDNGVTLMANLLDKNKPLPHIIYLDLNMPLMNGMECIRDIKDEEALSKIPIIIYSNSLDTTIQKVLYSQGASMYLIKPNSFQELQVLLGKSLEYVKPGNTSPVLSFKDFVLKP